MLQTDRFKIKYVGQYQHWPNCFEVREFYQDGGSVLSIYALSELLEEDLSYLLMAALDCCDFVPKSLALKEQIAFLQLGLHGDQYDEQ